MLRSLGMRSLRAGMAVVMARDALEKAEHPELKTLAQRIIDAQATESEQMQQWRSELQRN